MKIVSYNVNGIRAAIRKGFVEWLAKNDFDAVCIQETKANIEQVDLTEIEALGYQSSWFSAQKKGYSGVAIFYKKQPDLVEVGCGNETFDFEGRVIRADFGDLTLVNIYFPSGTSGGPRQDVKYAFLDHIFEWVNELKKTRPNIVLVGDYNIAHTENDIHNPKTNKKSSGFLPEEREWMTKWFESGFTDAFREKNPEMTQYSWWSYRANARNNNKGWRIDYQSVSEPIKDKIVEAYQLTEVKHSDHCPVYMEIEGY